MAEWTGLPPSPFTPKPPSATEGPCFWSHPQKIYSRENVRSVSNGGMDGTRTRDLLRDRQAL